MQPKVVLKPGRDKSVRNRHPWIFSGAIQSTSGFEDGSCANIYTVDEELLGVGYFNLKCSLAGRILGFGGIDARDAITASFDRALKFRLGIFTDSTNAYRIVNGEGDDIPGLVVDKYGDIVVIQIGTLGMEKLKPYVIDLIKRRLSPRAIYEKSNLPSRREEGLSNQEGFLIGDKINEVDISETNIRFTVRLQDSQKTGFFLDQREMRALLSRFSAGRKVLNCFSYTGGFSVCAAMFGAAKVDSVDSSEEAIALAKNNFSLNGLSTEANGFFVADVFDFLRERKERYDLIILDPPAFAKKKVHIKGACRGYNDINRLALERLNSDGLLLTCSCSYYIDEKLFQQIVFNAALEAKRRVQIIQKHRLALDHPQSIFHPEGSYLKSFLLYVT